MSIQELIRKYSTIEIELLLKQVLKKPQEFLLMNPGYKLSAIQLDSLSAMAKRRIHGEPVAYILGYKDFYGLRFKVNKNVLIPRPETEWIVDKILDLRLQIADLQTPLRILDLGAGSGAIIISLAQKCKAQNWNSRTNVRLFRFVGSDISKKALSVARQNAKKHGVNIKFYHSDLFKNIAGKFDVVIANLPYVPKTDLRLRMKDTRELAYEPKMALTDNTDHFAIYEKFFQQVRGHLHPESIIYLEIDPKTRPYIQKWVKKYLPEFRAAFYKDLHHLWRYVEIKVPSPGF